MKPEDIKKNHYYIVVLDKEDGYKSLMLCIGESSIHSEKVLMQNDNFYCIPVLPGNVLREATECDWEKYTF